MRTSLITLLLVSGFSMLTKAQFEVKLNPVVLLFEGGVVSAEFPLNPNFGAETTLIAVPDGGFGVFGMGKYYFRPRMGIDRFYAGAYVGFLEDLYGLGFHFGTKMVAQRGLIFEFSIGAGREFNDGGFFPYGKLDIGYRFGEVKNMME